VAWGIAGTSALSPFTQSYATPYLRFVVRDDGTGFDTSVTAHGTGLQGMVDRLEAIGGVVTVTSAPGAGTTVVGSIDREGGS